jgi:RNA polymerase sigma factor (sigma-70 family)
MRAANRHISLSGLSNRRHLWGEQNMTDDLQLLERYARQGSEDAFGQLVARHLNLVYSAALRQVGGEASLAQDVAQLVFANLARKAPVLCTQARARCSAGADGGAEFILAGWLHRDTRFTALELLRKESRRRHREQEAVAMQLLDAQDPPADWTQIRPLLDENLDRMPAADRDALLLRFFERRSFAEIGTALGVGEEAARKRVTRALDHLRELLARHGVTTTAAALAGLLLNQAVQAAPAGLAAALTTASLAAAASATTLGTLIQTMITSKAAFGLLTAATLGLTATVGLQHRSAQRLQTENAALRTQATQTPAVLPQPAAANAAQTAELARLRAEHAELLRLRGEVTSLRRALADAAKATPSEKKEVAVNSDPTPEDEARARAEEAKSLAIARMTYVKYWTLAFVLYAGDHDDQLPAAFDQAASYMPTDQTALLSTFTPDKFEILYQGRLKDLKDPASTILIREKEAWSNASGTGMARTYAFADGHSEIHLAPDGDFTAWESTRIVAPATR